MKKSKTSSARTKRPNQMTKEELIATLIKKKQCNAKALAIVERILDGDINPQWLLDSLQFISQSHYQDAVEERAITKLCGYPLCRNPLGDIPKQQFRISIRNNKVYDISERKNFCSNACYRSSSFLKDQIMTSPLWLRDIDKVSEYKLLHGGKITGGVGDEIDVGLTRITLQDALDSHGTSSHADHQSLEGVDNNCPLSEESTPNVSGNNMVGESPVVPPSGPNMVGESPVVPPSGSNMGEISPVVPSSGPNMVEESPIVPLSDILINKEQTLSASVLDELAALPGGSSRSSEKSGEILNSHEKTICENSPLVECSGIDTPSCSNVSKTRVEDRENNVNKQETASLNTAQESDTPTSSVILAEVIKEQKSPSTAENSSETSNPKEFENSKELKERDNRKAKVRKEKRTSRHAKVSPVALPCVSELVEERLKEWFTIDSLCFLYGEQRVREMLGQLGGDLEQNFKPLNSATWDPEKHDRFVNICKKLNLLDLEDKSYDDKVINEDKNIEKKPLPDFNKLKEEAEKMDLRVQAFYKGQFELEPKKVTFAEDTKEGTENQEFAVIPLVHQHEQRALRRRLVLDALNRVLPDLLRTLGVPSSQVNSTLRGLVGTFALTAGNITFNPRQWTLVAIVIIKLLSLREPRLQHALASGASQKYLTLIQMSYNLSPTFLDLLIHRLVSILPINPTEVN